MTLSVNNKQISYIEQETVVALLKRLNFTFPLLVVKINGTLIPRESYDTTIIPKDASIQIIHMISGG